MARGTRLRKLSPSAKLFFGLVIAAGMVVLLQAALHPSSRNIAEFVCYLLISLLASRVKVTLPEVGDSLSVNFLFVLIGILDLGFAETLMLGSVGALMQCFQGQRTRPLRIVFNVCASAFAGALAFGAYHQVSPLYGRLDLRPFLLVLAATVYFVINTAALVGAVVLTEGKSLDKTWVQSVSYTHLDVYKRQT